MSVISSSKYIISGIIIVFFTIFLLIVLTNQLRYSVEKTKSFILDKCKINSIIFTTVLYECWQDGFVTIIEMPCVQTIVKTTHLSDLIFYRNFIEKDFLNTNNLNCSYVPSACQNDPIYLDRILRKSIIKLFPPLNFTFNCYVDNDKTEALLYLPDSISYYVSLVVLSFGLCLGLSFIIHGFFNIQGNLKKKLLNFLGKLINQENDDELRKYAKKVLVESHMNTYHISTDILDIHSSTDKNNLSTLSGKATKSLSNKYGSDNQVISHNSSSLKEMNISANDSKLSPSNPGLNEFRTGRIEYRAPSSSRQSYSSRSSFSSSSIDIENNNRNESCVNLQKELPTDKLNDAKI